MVELRFDVQEMSDDQKRGFVIELIQSVWGTISDKGSSSEVYVWPCDFSNAKKALKIAQRRGVVQEWKK